MTRKDSKAMVVHFVLFLHVLGAITMGFYFLFPFLLGKIRALSITGQAGYLRVAYRVNFVSQFTLIAQFITGGYLISVSHVPTEWVIIVSTLFVGIGACMGIMSGKLRRTSNKLAGGYDVPYVRSISTLSGMTLVLLILTVGFMVFH